MTQRNERTTRRRAALHGSRGAESLAIRSITQRIRDGTYEPGQRLSEALLAADLKLSRNTIREALRWLSATGLVSFEPNRGARVVQLDRQDVADLFQLREVTEGLAARLSAMKINVPGNRDRVSALLDEVRELARLGYGAAAPKYFEHNTRFHEVILELSGNPHLIKAAKPLHIPALRQPYYKSMKPEMLAASISEHERIAVAMLNSDAAEAERLMRQHVRRSGSAIYTLPDEQFFRIYRA